jgi:hypothetical protein
MCQASTVADDWVKKGCHIHIGQIELAVYPDHRGGVGFKPFFAVKKGNKELVANALKTAREQCVEDPQIRKRWIRSLKQAILCMLSFDGEPSSLANGRMLEFKFLIIALERYQQASWEY